MLYNLVIVKKLINGDRHLPRVHANTGLTFIEIMITLVVIIVLTLVAVPALTALMKGQRLIGTTENLYSALQNARSEAIKTNTTVYVSFQTGSSWCYGINSGSACDC